MSFKRFPETNIGFVGVSSFIFLLAISKLAPNPKQFDLEGFFFTLLCPLLLGFVRGGGEWVKASMSRRGGRLPIALSLPPVSSGDEGAGQEATPLEQENATRNRFRTVDIEVDPQQRRQAFSDRR